MYRAGCSKHASNDIPSCARFRRPSARWFDAPLGRYLRVFCKFTAIVLLRGEFIALNDEGQSGAWRDTRKVSGVRRPNHIFDNTKSARNGLDVFARHSLQVAPPQYSYSVDELRQHIGSGKCLWHVSSSV